MQSGCNAHTMRKPTGSIMSRTLNLGLVAATAALALAVGISGARAQDSDQDALPLPPVNVTQPAVAQPVPGAAPQPLPAITQAAVQQSRQAIEECRQKRLRKEIATYKESAQCSNPRIFAAWKAANYPDMDLITEWLDAREQASEQVDARQLTPKQFEQRMDELTVRLTAEERRRRAGLIYSADNTLQLQLPPAGQVLGVATPASQARQATRLSAAARVRAANGLYMDPAAGGQGVGTMQALTPLNASRPPAGVGGPFIPVPPNSPAARAALAREAARNAPGPGSSGLYALVASQQSEADAHTAFQDLQAQYPDILGDRDAVIRRADFGAQGVYYRVEIGPLSSAEADQLCSQLKQAGGQCASRFE
jgi:hypothetical protein